MPEGVSRSSAGRGADGAGRPPAVAAVVFGPALAGACRYADALAVDGVRRGLIGPREVDRLWSRHLLNAAVLGALVPRAASVCDVGSGAGLPGVALAVARPDLSVTLLEPLERRVAFLEEVVARLGLARVRVLRGRAPGVGAPVLDPVGRPMTVAPFDVVTARAVAPLDRLAPMLVPLGRPGGTVLALKGRSADREVAELGTALDTLDPIVASVDVVELGFGEATATVVRLTLGPRRPAVGRIRSGSSRRAGTLAGRR